MLAAFKKLFLILFLPLLIIPFSFSFAKECNEGDPTLQQICLDLNELNKSLQMSVDATKPLESELNKLESQINSIQKAINIANNKIKTLEENIFQREVDLEYQNQVLALRVRSYYKKSRQYSPFLIFLASSSAKDLFRELSYRQTAASEDRKIIAKISQEIIDLSEDKEALEKNKISLAASQKKLDKDAEFFRTEVGAAKAFQTQLSTEIAELTAKQQAILAARSGSFITSVGSVPIGSDYNASIAGFESEAPNGYFAVFSFGAYTHRKGMSQYGAKARADDNQKYEQILQAYYPGSNLNKDYSEPSTINIKGDGISCNGSDKYYDETVNFQTYLKRIYEIPSSWHKEAQKAQAVAARTYAIRQINNKGYIRPSEADQMYKDCDKGGDWISAVQETEKDVLLDGGGQPVMTYYSSTSGGYLTTMGWDTTDGSGSGDWTSRAWESKAGSPWFYKAWYREKYRNDSNDCSRKPWMSEEEMADILNVWLILNNGEGNGVDTSRILPVTINQCPIGGQSGNPYSMAELRDKLNNPVISISGETSISHDGDGNTTMVTFQTNRGALPVPGYEFKERFNGRAPGYLSIPQSGFAFFNIERK